MIRLLLTDNLPRMISNPSTHPIQVCANPTQCIEEGRLAQTSNDDLLDDWLH